MWMEHPAEKVAWRGEPAIWETGRSDRGDKDVYGEVIIGSFQWREVEKKESCHRNREAAVVARRWSRWIAPENCLGSRWISIAMLGSSWEGAHEFFTEEEYDARASLQAIYTPANQHIKVRVQWRREAQPLTFKFQILKLYLMIVRLVEEKSMHVHRI